MQKLNYLLQLGDNALILSHRLSEWCGHGPVLEQDIALTNIALDLLGQARMLLTYAAELENKGRTEDDLAYLRDVQDLHNLLLVEQPNTDWAYTIARQFFYDAYSHPLYTALSKSQDERLAAIAEKSLKEVTYHLRFSSEWMLRLGDGTAVSHEKIQAAVDDLWMYTGEIFNPSPADMDAVQSGYGPDLGSIKPIWEQKLREICEKATLTIPQNTWMQAGGKTGVHTEYLGYLLAEMQYLQRTYPGNNW